MNQIVLIYDVERSKSISHFTVRLEERIFINGKWGKTGKTKVYFASDLAAMKSRFADVELVKVAMESELDLRKTEGKFSTGNVELTLLRISPRILKTFLQSSKFSNALCNDQGHILRFNIIQNTKPDVYIRSIAVDSSTTLDLFIAQKNYPDRDYTVFSGAVFVFFGMELFVFEKNYLDIFRKVSFGKPLGPEPFAKAKNLLSRHSDLLTIHFPQETERKTLAAFVPVFDLARDLKIANLYFQYGNKQVAYDAPEKTFTDMDKKVTVVRDLDKEKALLSILIEEGLHRPSSRGGFFLSAVNRVQKLRHLEEKGFQIVVDTRPLRLDMKMDLSINLVKEKIVVKGKVRGKQSDAPIQDVVAAINKHEQVFSFNDGSVGFVSPLKDELKALRGHYGNGEISLRKDQFGHLADKALGEINYHSDERFQALLEFGQGDDQLKNYRTPPVLEQVLRPYQAYGFIWLCNLHHHGFGGILADDMGLGKTLQVLAFLLRFSKAATRTLLVVPKTLIYNWEIEIQRFAPSLKYYVYSHNRQQRDLSRYPLVITTYGVVRSAQDGFDKTTWDALILDEAQYIKNHHTDTSRKIRRVAAKFRLALTGTPLENSLTDLYSIFDFLMPGFFGSLKGFKQQYNSGHPRDLEKLRNLIKPFILRRLKKQVCKELPSKTEVAVFCELNRTQAEVYRRTLRQEKRRLEKGGQKNESIHILTALLRLRQIACNLRLISKEYGTDSGKLAVVTEMAEAITLGGNNILVFSQFTKHLAIVKQVLKDASIKYYYLDGATRDRKSVISKFQKEKKPCVFLISLKTGGVGLNLTNANYVFLLDPWWNPAVENQAIDRCYRIGQTDPVTVYRFITRKTIEEKIMILKAMKKQMEDSVIEAEDPDHIPLTEAELRQLILDDAV